jgi:hypothetical protein
MYSSSIQLGHPWPVVPISRHSPSPVFKSKPLAPAVTIKTVGSCCWLVWLHTFHTTKDMFRPRKFFYLALKNIVWMFGQVTTFRLASSHLESPSFPIGFLLEDSPMVMALIPPHLEKIGYLSCPRWVYKIVVLIVCSSKNCHVHRHIVFYEISSPFLLSFFFFKNHAPEKMILPLGVWR